MISQYKKACHPEPIEGPNPPSGEVPERRRGSSHLEPVEGSHPDHSAEISQSEFNHRGEKPNAIAVMPSKNFCHQGGQPGRIAGLSWPRAEKHYSALIFASFHLRKRR